MCNIILKLSIKSQKTIMSIMIKDDEIKKPEIEPIDEDMSFSNAKNESKYKHWYFGSPYIKKGESGHFSYSKIIDNKFIPIKGVTKSVSGKVVKIYFGSYKRNDEEEVETLKILLETLNGNNELVAIQLSTSWTKVAIGLVNRLLNLDKPLEDLSIELFQDPKSLYNNAKIRFNGISIDKKYDKEFLESKIERFKDTKTGKVKYSDYSNLIDFLKEELTKHLPTILPHFHLEDEVVKPQVEFVEQSMSEVLDTDEDMMADIVSDMPETKKKGKK